MALNVADLFTQLKSVIEDTYIACGRQLSCVEFDAGQAISCSEGLKIVLRYQGVEQVAGENKLPINLFDGCKLRIPILSFDILATSCFPTTQDRCCNIFDYATIRLAHDDLFILQIVDSFMLSNSLDYEQSFSNIDDVDGGCVTSKMSFKVAVCDIACDIMETIEEEIKNG